tara:strand:- start:561 stop:722 length:162 start_codon:yes stop_codon:yes gene_type:complete
MSTEHTTYVVKSIPRDVWRHFKMRFLQDGFDTCNEALLYIITRYSDGDLDVKK